MALEVQDLNHLSMVLKNSFKAIKKDINRIKEAQNTQIRELDEITVQIDDFRQSFVKKTEFGKKVTETEKHLEETFLKQLNDMKIYNTELVATINQRIVDLNKQFQQVETTRKEVDSLVNSMKRKVKRIDSFEKDLKDLRKNLQETKDSSVDKKDLTELKKQVTKLTSTVKKLVTEKQVSKLLNDINSEFDKVKDEKLSKDDFRHDVASLKKEIAKIKKKK